MDITGQEGWPRPRGTGAVLGGCRVAAASAVGTLKGVIETALKTRSIAPRSLNGSVIVRQRTPVYAPCTEHIGNVSPSTDRINTRRMDGEGFGPTSRPWRNAMTGRHSDAENLIIRRERPHLKEIR